MFVRSADGSYYPLTSIERLWTSDDGVEHAALSGGKDVQLEKGQIDRLMVDNGKPFPAAPDTYVLEQIDERCRSSSYARVPVLAWVMCQGRGVLPITIEGINHGMNRTVPVLMPSGEIVVAGDCTYADEDCYLDELKSAKAS